MCCFLLSAVRPDPVASTPCLQPVFPWPFPWGSFTLRRGVGEGCGLLRAKGKAPSSQQNEAPMPKPISKWLGGWGFHLNQADPWAGTCWGMLNTLENGAPALQGQLGRVVGRGLTPTKFHVTREMRLSEIV